MFTELLLDDQMDWRCDLMVIFILHFVPPSSVYVCQWYQAGRTVSGDHEAGCVCLSGIRHSVCFWFSGQARGDHGEPLVSEGVASVNSFGAVRGQHTAVLPHAAGDGQTGLVPHGF